ncbi:hypothetical protein [Streptomyces sp. NPDC048106]|uniref:hypothetical protein n=1 Tax=Streptomyces sp. NPDC048106 TaxID=3155750 RepID=UPI003451862B
MSARPTLRQHDRLLLTVTGLVAAAVLLRLMSPDGGADAKPTSPITHSTHRPAHSSSPTGSTPPRTHSPLPSSPTHQPTPGMSPTRQPTSSTPPTLPPDQRTPGAPRSPSGFQTSGTGQQSPASSPPGHRTPSWG